MKAELIKSLKSKWESYCNEVGDRLLPPLKEAYGVQEIVPDNVLEDVLSDIPNKYIDGLSATDLKDLFENFKDAEEIDINVAYDDYDVKFEYIDEKERTSCYVGVNHPGPQEVLEQFREDKKNQAVAYENLLKNYFDEVNFTSDISYSDYFSEEGILESVKDESDEVFENIIECLDKCLEEIKDYEQDYYNIISCKEFIQNRFNSYFTDLKLFIEDYYYENISEMDIYTTIYSKANAEKEFVEHTNDVDELAEIIDEIREKADKRDKIKVETYLNEDELFGRIFIVKNEFADDLVLKNKVREVLEKSGMSKLELSNRIGVAYINTCNLIDREFLDSTALINAVKIADALDVNVQDLYEREETIKPTLPTKITFEKLKEMLKK